VQNQKRCIEWLAKKLNVNKKEDWYRVTNEAVKSVGGGGLVQYHGGSFTKALQVF
jgi:hypothetical protein